MIGWIMLAIAIVITIAYLIYSIWNVFVAKKQTKITWVDMGYIIIVTLFTGMITKIEMILLIGVLLIAWLVIINQQSMKNRNKEE